MDELDSSSSIEKFNIIQEFDLSNFERKEKIGFGGFGEVYLIKNEETREIYAAKSIYMNKITSENDITKIKREVKFTSSIVHPCILHLYGMSTHPTVTLITDYYPQSSLDVLLSRKPDSLDMTHRYIIAYGISIGMDFLKTNKIMHRDLKTQNILLTDEFYPIISDFGLSKIVELNNFENSTKDGTILIQPPEMENSIFEFRSDVYCYSLILYELFAGLKFPSSMKELFNSIKDKYRPKFSPEFNEKLKDLIEKCWDPDVENRPYFDEIKTFFENEEILKELKIDKDRFNKYKMFISVSHKVYQREASNPIIPQKDVAEFKRKNSLNIFPIVELNKLSDECKEDVQAAQNGSVEKMKFVGRCLIEGEHGFKSNPELGMQFLNLAEKHSNEDKRQEVKYIKAQYLYEGKVVPRNIRKARELLIGCKPFCYEQNILLARIELELGINNPNCLKIMNNAAKNSFLDSYLIYSKLLLRLADSKNEKLEIKYDDSFFYLNKAYEQFLKYLEDKNAGKDTLYWRKKKESCTEATAYCALFYYNGFIDTCKKKGITVGVDFFKARELSRLASKHGDMTGAAVYAMCLVRGLGIGLDFGLDKNNADYEEKKEKIPEAKIDKKHKEDIELGIELAKRSSKSRNNKGRNVYGLFLNHGVGSLMKNRKKSAQLWKMSAAEGDAFGQFLYGCCLIQPSDEYNVPQNIKLGIEYIQKAIDGGCLPAMAYFGLLLIFGRFVDKGEERGKKYLEFAACHGDAFAIVVLAYFCINEGKISEATNYLYMGKKRKIADCYRMLDFLVVEKHIEMKKSKNGKKKSERHYLEKAEKIESFYNDQPEKKRNSFSFKNLFHF